MQGTTPTKMSFFYRIFCWIGGGDRKILNELPTERNRFFGYGTVISMTAIFAVLSSYFAFSYLIGEENYWALIPATIWGTFIFILDRFFVTSIANSGSFWRKFWSALPRIIIAFFIGIIISKPIEFKIFEPEIREQLATNGRLKTQELEKAYSTSLDSLNSWRDKAISNLDGGDLITEEKQKIKRWQATLDLKEDKVDELRTSFNKEIEGTGGSMRRGLGKVARAKKEQLEDAIEERDQLVRNIAKADRKIERRQEALENQIAEKVTPEYERLRNALTEEDNRNREISDEAEEPSILNQQIALSQIPAAVDEDGNLQFPGSGLAILFITSLFIAIELAPMGLKLLSKPGAYERRLAQKEAMYSTEDRLNRSLNLEEYKSNRKLVQQLAVSQRKIISKALDDWHAKHMDELTNNPEHYQTFLGNDHEEDSI